MLQQAVERHIGVLVLLSFFFDSLLFGDLGLGGRSSRRPEEYELA